MQDNQVALLAAELTRTQSPEVVRALAEAVTNIDDEQVCHGVLEALRSVTDQRCIDEICAVWAKTRHRELGSLLEQVGWVAAAPEWLRLLTALKSGQLETIEPGGAEIVAPLLRACEDTDSTVAAQARLVLQRLPKPEAQEELYRLVIETDHPLACEIAATVQHAPRDPQQRALFFLLTGQWERYDELDFDRSLVRAAYQVGNEWLQGRIADLTRRAGRVDFVEVIAGGRQRRRLAEMTDSEWAVVLSLLNKHQAWPEMWQLAQVAPAGWSVQLLRRLGEEGWLPEDKDPFLGEQTDFRELVQLARRCRAEGLQLGSSVRCQATLAGHSASVYDLATNPAPLSSGSGGQWLASGSGDRTLRLWRLPDGKSLKALTGHTDEVWGVTISPDGRLLVSGSDDRTIRLWRLPDGKALKTLKGQTDTLNALVISPVPLDGGTGQWLLASGSEDHTVQLWSLPDGKGLKTLTGHTDLIIDLAISPDGRLLASGSRDGTARLWSLPDGAPLKTLSGHTSSVNCLAFSSNGRLLVSGSLDKTVRLWRLPEGRLFKTLKGHTDAVVDVAISPTDTPVLASGSLDKTVRLWNLANGTLLKTLTGHTDWIMGLAISADGQLLASGSEDQTIRLWSSDLAHLSHRPVTQTDINDKSWVEETLQHGKISIAERGWLEFILALIRWRRRFDIEVEEAPRRISIGEFDIEIEG